MKGREGGLLAERSGWRGRPDSAFSASATHQKCIAKAVADGIRLALDSIANITHLAVSHAEESCGTYVQCLPWLVLSQG